MEDDLVKQALLKVRRTQRQSSFLDEFAVIYFKKLNTLQEVFFYSFLHVQLAISCRRILSDHLKVWHYYLSIVFGANCSCI